MVVCLLLVVAMIHEMMHVYVRARVCVCVCTPVCVCVCVHACICTCVVGKSNKQVLMIGDRYISLIVLFMLVWYQTPVTSESDMR